MGNGKQRWNAKLEAPGLDVTKSAELEGTGKRKRLAQNADGRHVFLPDVAVSISKGVVIT